MPILIFLAIFFFYPAINLLFFSLLTQDAKGIVGPPLTLAHYTLLRDALYRACSGTRSDQPGDLGRRDRARLSRGDRDGAQRPDRPRIIAMIVIAPLIVSVVVRTYGWQLILGQQAGRHAELAVDLTRHHQIAACTCSIRRPPW